MIFVKNTWYTRERSRKFPFGLPFINRIALRISKDTNVNDKAGLSRWQKQSTKHLYIPFHGINHKMTVSIILGEKKTIMNKRTMIAAINVSKVTIIFLFKNNIEKYIYNIFVILYYRIKNI